MRSLFGLEGPCLGHGWLPPSCLPPTCLIPLSGSAVMSCLCQCHCVSACAPRSLLLSVSSSFGDHSSLHGLPQGGAAHHSCQKEGSPAGDAAYPEATRSIDARCTHNPACKVHTQPVPVDSVMLAWSEKWERIWHQFPPLFRADDVDHRRSVVYRSRFLPTKPSSFELPAYLQQKGVPWRAVRSLTRFRLGLTSLRAIGYTSFQAPFPERVRRRCPCMAQY